MVNNVLCFTGYATGRLLLCHFGPSHSLTRSEISAKSNHSRTSSKFSRKSNYSRTYAETGGWGLTFELSTGHPAKDAHPERAVRAEGSLRLLPLFPLLARPPQLQRRRATNSTHSSAIGNCGPTRRTRSSIYHYITYPLSARRHFWSAAACRRLYG